MAVMTATPALIRFTGKTGQVGGRGIHDADVLGFEMATDEHFTLHLRGADGIARRISFRGLREIGFQDVINGMIVIDIFAWQLDDAPGAMAEVYPDVWRSLLGERYVAEHLTAEIARLARRDEPLLLVSIVTAYGGAIAAICRDIVWLNPTDEMMAVEES
jgi:hypothetical protein